LERCPELRIVEYRGDDMTQVYGSEPIYLDAHTPWPAHFSQFAESTYP